MIGLVADTHEIGGSSPSAPTKEDEPVVGLGPFGIRCALSGVRFESVVFRHASACGQDAGLISRTCEVRFLDEAPLTYSIVRVYCS